MAFVSPPTATARSARQASGTSTPGGRSGGGAARASRRRRCRNPPRPRSGAARRRSPATSAATCAACSPRPWYRPSSRCSQPCRFHPTARWTARRCRRRRGKRPRRETRGGRRRAPPKSSWRVSGRSFSGARRWRSTTTSSRSAATPWWRPACCRGCARPWASSSSSAASWRCPRSPPKPPRSPPGPPPPPWAWARSRRPCTAPARARTATPRSSPTPRSASGCSRSWRRRAPPTTSPARSACVGRSLPRAGGRFGRRSARSCAATRSCVPPTRRQPTAPASRARWSCRSPPRRCRGSTLRRSARRRSGRWWQWRGRWRRSSGDGRSRLPAGHSSASPWCARRRTITCSSSPSTISWPTAGRWRSSCASWPRSTSRSAPAGAHRCRNCRRCPYSTRTSHAGSASIWTPPRSPRISPTGGRRWPAHRAAWRSPSTGRGRRCRARAAHASRCRCRRGWARSCAAPHAAPERPSSWRSSPPSTCCSPASPAKRIWSSGRRSPTANRSRPKA